MYNLLGVPPSGFQAELFVTSWCLPAYLLATVRIFLSVYCFTTIIYSFAWFAGHQVVFHLQDIGQKPITFAVGSEGIRQSFSYFTYLSYWGLAFYFFFASMHTFVYARRKQTWLATWPRSLQALHSMFYTSIVCLPLLVTTIYWGSMWYRKWFVVEFSQWNMISIHALNSVFAIFEITMTKTDPLPWLHLGVLLLIMSLYLPIAYITKATEGVYVYLWLDPAAGVPRILLHVVGYAAAVTAYFLLVRLAIYLRCCITKTPSEQAFRVLSRERDSRETENTLWSDRDIEMQAEEKRMELDLDALTEPVPLHFPHERPSFNSTLSRPLRDFPQRKSSYNVRNFTRPESQTSVQSKHSGFWI